jgi:hypothetical protein
VKLNKSSKINYLYKKMQIGLDLKNLTEICDKQLNIYKHSLNSGDLVYLKTANSAYTIKVTGKDEYMVSGGWFDAQNLSPYRIKIRGCTWGGSAINTEIIAAPGLCIEFSNNLITSIVNKIFFFSHKSFN